MSWIKGLLSNRRRVIVISHTGSLGGAELSLLAIVKCMREHNFELIVWVPYEGVFSTQLRREGIPVSVHSYPWWMCFQDQANPAELEPKNQYSDFLKKAKKYQPDLIFSQSLVIPWGALLAYDLGIPHFWSVCEWGDLDYSLQFCFDKNSTLRFVHEYSDAVFYVSQSLKDAYCQPPSPGIVTYRGFDLNQILTDSRDSREMELPAVFFKPDLFLIYCAGTITPGKGQMDMVEAAAQLQACGITNFHVLFVGNDLSLEYREALTLEIHKLKLEGLFSFLGWQSQNLFILSRSHLFVSCAKNEAFGRSVVEAGLIGVPMVISASGGHREILGNAHHRLMYKPGNPQELAQKIKINLLEYEKAVEIACNVHQTIKDIFANSIAYERIIQSILSAGFRVKKPSSISSDIERSLRRW